MVTGRIKCVVMVESGHLELYKYNMVCQNDSSLHNGHYQTTKNDKI